MINPGVYPSERAFNPQTVCVPATGVYIARALLGTKIPGTVEEVLALATIMGAPYGAGANYTKLAAGMKERYGLVGSVVEGGPQAQTAVKYAIERGPYVVGLAGDQLNLQPHYQPNSVGHSIAVLYPYSLGLWGLQLDPLAPAGYKGDPFGAAELNAYCTAAILFKAPALDCTVEVKAATDTLTKKLVAIKQLAST